MSIVTAEKLKSFAEKFANKIESLFVKKEEGKGLSSNDYTTEEKNKLAGIAEGANKTTVDSELSSTSVNPVQNKVIKSALDLKMNASTKGAAGGVAELDSTGKVPSSQLPSFVDDVIEGYLSAGKFYKESAHTNQITAESGKIYVDITDGQNKTYRWSGSSYVEISESLVIGETSSTAYRGDKGKIAYDHSQTVHAPANAEANVQSDWNETDSSSDAYIKNKPATFAPSSHEHILSDISDYKEITDEEIDEIISGTFSV